MDAVHAWGLDLIRMVQTVASPMFTAIMKAVSAMGSEAFYLPALAFIYWCVDRKRGARLALVFLASAFVNAWFKDLFGQPRPYLFDVSVGLANETTFSFPSGHAQGSIVFWGLAAVLFPKPWGLVTAVIFPLLIGFSRVYLGVHFPTDVLAGWGIGALFLVGNALVGDRLEAVLPRLGSRWRLIIIAILAFIMNALYRGDVSLAGAFIGAGFGFVWAAERAAFSAGGRFWPRAGRYAAGLALTVAIYILPKIVAPSEGEALYALVRFFRYAVLGAWISLGAPWLFMRLRLASAG
jgi:hypothetical protein